MDPASGSALGGERVCLEGRGLDPAQGIFFGGARATRHKLDEDGRLCVTTPAGIAGPVTVAVRGKGDRGATLEDAFTYEALELAFSEAASHYLPTPAVALEGGVLLDLGADGLDDLVVLDEDGVLTPWRNAGTGAFAVDQPLPLGGTVAGLAVARWDDATALFACHADEEAARLLLVEGGELVELPEAVPAEAGPCTGAVAADLDGDGAEELVELRADGTLRAWGRDGWALVRYAATEAEDAVGCGTLSAAEGVTATCEVEAGSALLTVEGEGEAALGFALPALPREDDGFSLWLGGGPVRLEVTDAVGEVFAWDPGGGAAVALVSTPPVALWTPTTAGALPTPPLATLALVLDGTGATRPLALELGEVLLRLADGGRAVVASFEAWPADAEVAATDLVAVQADEDGLPALVAGTAAGPVLLLARTDGFVAAPVGALPAADCAVGALVAADTDADGPDEIVAACDGQDLLYRGDGTGRFFEDGAASLPVDGSPGADVTAADLDRDGLPELIIANDGGVHRLYHGEGARFADWSARLSLEAGTGVAALVTDVDGDRDLDVLVLQGGGEASRLFVSLAADE